MKKLIVGSLFASIACSAAFATISDDEIIASFPPIAQGVNISVEKREKLENTAFEKIVILLKKDDQEYRQIMFSDGKYLFPDIIDTAAKRSYASEFRAEQEKILMSAGYENLAKLLKTYPKNKIVSLGKDKKKPVKVIFTDPLCPYCKQEMKNIHERLKEANLRLIFAPIPSHGEEAVAKSLSIQKEARKAKKDSEIIAILEKYYADDSVPASNISTDEIEKEKMLIDSIFATGAIRGVPAIIDGKDIDVK